jgi:HEAT repeat protein
VCSRLADEAKKMIKSDNYSEALPVVAALRMISDSPPSSETTLRTCTRNALEKLAETKVQDLLLEETDSNKKGLREEACQILTYLGSLCVERLLHILRQSRTGQERVRVLKMIVDMGSQAAPFVRGALGEDEPWYFLRNVARLLGEIGSEKDLDVLLPLLDHTEFRVRWQALNSIYHIGGQRRGEILLQRLAEEEDRMRIHIVSMLGELRQREAVPLLVKLLEKKSLVNSGEKIQLQKKACAALAKIGSPLAIPVLSEITRSRKLKRLGSHHPQVREAARLSLHSLQTS